MRADEGGIEHVNRGADACHQYLRREIVVFVNRADLFNKIHANVRDIVQATHKWADVGGASFGGEEGLVCRKTQCHIGFNAFVCAHLDGFESFGHERYFHHDVFVNLSQLHRFFENTFGVEGDRLC